MVDKGMSYYDVINNKQHYYNMDKAMKVVCSYF